MQLFDGLLSDTHETYLHVGKAYEEKDYELRSMRVHTTELEEELELKRTRWGDISEEDSVYESWRNEDNEEEEYDSNDNSGVDLEHIERVLLSQDRWIKELEGENKGLKLKKNIGIKS